MEEYIEIGHTKKARGIAGELKIFVEDRYLDDFMASPVVFLEVGGGKVPFFIEYVKEVNDLYVKFEDHDDRQAVIALTGKAAFLREQDISSDDEDAEMEDYSFLEGFEIMTKREGVIGKIEEVIEMPQQIMGIVLYQGREVLIPLNDQFIIAVDPEKGVLEMELPEGLLDL